MVWTFWVTIAVGRNDLKVTIVFVMAIVVVAIAVVAIAVVAIAVVAIVLLQELKRLQVVRSGATIDYFSVLVKLRRMNGGFVNPDKRELLSACASLKCRIK